MADSVIPSVLQRVTREFRDANREPSKFWTLTPLSDSLRKWTGQIHNLDDKRHRCRKYRLSIDIPAEYPFTPPKIKFIDRVRCENVYEDGTICIDILGSAWSPSFTLPRLMETIVSVLTDKPVTGLINKPMPSAMPSAVPSAMPSAVPSAVPALVLNTEMPPYGTREFWKWAQERRNARRINQNVNSQYRNVLIRT